MKTVKFPLHRDEASLRAFAAACEADFKKRLNRLVDRIAADPRRLIALAGPSCAGKTTTAHRIIDRLAEAGRRVQVVSLDDFYRPRDVLIAESAGKSMIDFDSPATLDWAKLSAFIDDVLEEKDRIIDIQGKDLVSLKREIVDLKKKINYSKRKKK